jgi:hypothetical protein
MRGKSEIRRDGMMERKLLEVGRGAYELVLYYKTVKPQNFTNKGLIFRLLKVFSA